MSDHSIVRLQWEFGWRVHCRRRRHLLHRELPDVLLCLSSQNLCLVSSFVPQYFLMAKRSGQNQATGKLCHLDCQKSQRRPIQKNICSLQCYCTSMQMFVKEESQCHCSSHYLSCKTCGGDFCCRKADREEIVCCFHFLFTIVLSPASCDITSTSPPFEYMPFVRFLISCWWYG